MHWDITGTVYNNQYSAFNFDYIEANTVYGISFWGFWYNNATAPYNAGDSFVYLPEDASIPAYGINYTAGWYFGNRSNPAQLVQISPPTITIGSGEDLYNQAFITWLHDNATLVNN